MGLKFFKRGTYDSVSNALSLIRQEFEALWAKIGDIRPGEEGALAEQQSYIPDIGSPVAEHGYNGMFKCEMYQKDENTTVVRVYDGAYAFAKDVSLNDFNRYPAGYCYVNGRSFQVPVFYKEYTSLAKFWWLKFDYKNGKSEAVVTIVDSSTDDECSPPDFDSNTSWYLLASFINTKFIQNHMSGIPQMLWFRNCNEDVDNV